MRAQASVLLPFAAPARLPGRSEDLPGPDEGRSYVHGVSDAAKLPCTSPSRGSPVTSRSRDRGSARPRPSRAPCASERSSLAGSRAADGCPGGCSRRSQPPIPGETPSCRQPRHPAPARARFSFICSCAVSTITATSSSATNPHSTARSSVGPARASRRPANNRARSCRSAPCSACGPRRDEIIVCTGVKIAGSGIQYWGSGATGLFVNGKYR